MTDAESAIIIGERPPLIEIEDAAHHDQTCEELALLKKGKRRVEAEIKTIKDPLNQARAAVLAIEKRAVGRFDAWITAYERAILTWRRAAEAKRLTDEARIRAEQEAKARAEQEARATAIAHAAAAAPAADRAILAELAEAIAAQPVAVEPVVVESPVNPKAGGLHTRTTWHAEIVDFGALVAAVAEGTLPYDVLQPNMPQLNALAQQFKNLLSLPGVVAKPDEGLVG